MQSWNHLSHPASKPKKTRKMKTKRNQGFTLIELLVVITIIAILASIAAPVFNSVQKKAQQTKALTYAKQIGLACKLYSLDNDGNFPANDELGAAYTTSTALFDAELIAQGYLPNEAIFYVVGDNSATATKLIAPDNDGTLAPTENAWSYGAGCSDLDTPNLPVVYTQVATATTFQTADNVNEPGGVWEGRVIVVNIDYSGSVERVLSTGLVNRNFGGGEESILAPAAANVSVVPTVLVAR